MCNNNNYDNNNNDNNNNNNNNNNNFSGFRIISFNKHVTFTSLLNEITPKWMCEGTTYSKAMTQQTLKTIDQSLVFQQPTNL